MYLSPASKLQQIISKRMRVYIGEVFGESIKRLGLSEWFNKEILIEEYFL